MGDSLGTTGVVGFVNILISPGIFPLVSSYQSLKLSASLVYSLLYKIY